MFHLFCFSGAFHLRIAWERATEEIFSGRTSLSGRYGFVGKEASQDTKNLYLHKRVPEEYRKRGAANPIRYTY